MTYTEKELEKQSNASLNRLIDNINIDIKRRGLKKPRLKKSGNKQEKINRILAYYAPKPSSPPSEPESEEGEKMPGEKLTVVDSLTMELIGSEGDVKEKRIVTDEAELFYNKTFRLPESTPNIKNVLSQLKDGFLTDEEFVRWGYLKVLGREPDQVGKAVYLSHFKNKTLNRIGFIQALFGSNEYRHKRDSGFFDNLGE